jgi:predicted metal-dependent phosphoesterase TrpH
MKFRIDLHVHTKYSGDNDSDPEESVIRAIERGMNGVAFTEHYSYEASEPVESLKEKYKDSIKIFRGVEFTSAEGHCLIFGVNTDRVAVKYAPVQDLARTVNESDGVIIPSHPFRQGNSLGNTVREVSGLCALEGYNGCNMHSLNEKAVEMAKTLNLPFTGGSDAHASIEVGSCFTEFDDPVTYENFIDLLRRGRYRGVDARKIAKSRFFF